MTEKKRLSCFWLEWILANAVGWGLGCSSILMAILMIGFMVLPAPEIKPGDFSWTVLFTEIAAIAGGVGGFLAGSMQWFILQRHTSSGIGEWILPSVAGWMLGTALLIGAGWGIDRNTTTAITEQLILTASGAAGSFAASLGQWLILSRKFRQAGWWMLVNIVGLLAGGATTYALTGWALDLDSLCLGLVAPGGAAGVAYGIVTGWALGMILRHTKQ